MNKNILAISIIILILLVSITSFAENFNNDENVTDENNVTEDLILDEPEIDITEDIEIILEEDEYIEERDVKGMIRIKIDQEIHPQEKFYLDFGTESYEYNITDLLNKLNKNYNLVKSDYVRENPETNKKLYLDEDEPTMIGFVVPEFSEILEFNMKIKGPSDNTLEIPSMDIGNDGWINWEYLGDFVGWEDDYVTGSGFSEVEGDITFLMDNKTHLCQYIQMPYSKDFNIYSNYKRIASGGNITAIVLTAYGDPGRLLVTGQSQRCNLPESTSFGYKSCSIKMEFATNDPFLVCISSTKQNEEIEMYEVKSNNEPPITSYNCEQTGPVSFNCQQSYSDYFIKVKGAKYSRVLNKDINFKDWGTSLNSIILSLMNYVASPTPEGFEAFYFEPSRSQCSDTLCLVPITLYAEKSGDIEFYDLDLRYRSKGAVSTTRTFYELTKSEPYIDTIEGQDLANNSYILEITFSDLDIKTPHIDDMSQRIRISAEFLGEKSKTEYITVFKGEIPKRGLALDIENMLIKIEELENLGPKIDELMEIMNYKTILTDAKNELRSIESTLETQEETSQLINQFNNIVNKIPKGIEFIGTGADIIFVEVNDIPDNIVPAHMTKEEIYFQQQKVTVNMEIDNFVITEPDNTQNNAKLITKTINANEQLNDFQIYEIVNKAVINNVNDIHFKETPEIIQHNPIVKYYQASLSPGSRKTIKYAFKSNAPEIRLGHFKTIIVQEFEEEPEEEYFPEEEKKSRIWLFIFIILLVGGAGYYLMFYKGKYSLNELLPKKNPFHSKKDLKAVMDFIKKQKEKKKKDEEIKKLLISKEWKKAQIEYAFEEIENEKLKEEDLKSIKEYVKRAKKSKIEKKQIKENLLKAGWDEKLIEEVLKKE